MKVDYKRMLRDVEVKQSQVNLDQVNTDRLAGLVQSGGVTRAEYDNARFQLATDKQAVEALKLAAAVQLAKLGGDPEVDVHTMSDYLQAKAKLDEAQRRARPHRDLRTVRRRRDDGGYRAAGDVSGGLDRRVRPCLDRADLDRGQPQGNRTDLCEARRSGHVTVDTYPGRHWNCSRRQHRAQQRLGVFSVLPAQNTSGNWVKVVQRIPVRITCDRKSDDPEFRAGMSVIADIDTGHHRSWRELF